jgi:hypothetical protein
LSLSTQCSFKLRLGAMLGRLQEMIARRQNQPVPNRKRNNDASDRK